MDRLLRESSNDEGCNDETFDYGKPSLPLRFMSASRSVGTQVGDCRSVANAQCQIDTCVFVATAEVGTLWPEFEFNFEGDIDKVKNDHSYCRKGVGT